MIDCMGCQHDERARTNFLHPSLTYRWLVRNSHWPVPPLPNGDPLPSRNRFDRWRFVLLWLGDWLRLTVSSWPSWYLGQEDTASISDSCYIVLHLPVAFANAKQSLRQLGLIQVPFFAMDQVWAGTKILAAAGGILTLVYFAEEDQYFRSSGPLTNPPGMLENALRKLLNGDNAAALQKFLAAPRYETTGGGGGMCDQVIRFAEWFSMVLDATLASEIW